MNLCHQLEKLHIDEDMSTYLASLLLDTYPDIDQDTQHMIESILSEYDIHWDIFIQFLHTLDWDAINTEPSSPSSPSSSPPSPTPPLPLPAPKLIKKRPTGKSIAADTIFQQDIASPPLPADPSLGVCKHMLTHGHCYVLNCPFQHDLSQTVCKFWLSDACTAGHACKFLHALPTMPADDSDAQGQQDLQWVLQSVLQAGDSRQLVEQPSEPLVPGAQPSPPVPSSAAFPSLPTGAAPSSASPDAAWPTTSSWQHSGDMGTIADSLKLHRLRAAAEVAGLTEAQLPASDLEELYVRCDRQEDAALRCIQERFELPATPAVPVSDMVCSAPVSAAGSARAGAGGRTAQGRRGTALAGSSAALRAADVSWVDTGVHASADYKRARAEAEELAVARNKCFQRATQAFLAGSGAEARAWSKQGRELDAQMRQAHAQAAAHLFAQRNAALSVTRAGLQAIDVHTLHPDEAVHAMWQELQSARDAPGCGIEWLAVVVGTGHHSAGAASGVMVALQQALDDSEEAWFETGKDSHGGMLMIQVSQH